MKLGMFMQPVHRHDRDYTQVLEEDRQSIILADKLGFSEVWIGEHMTATIEPITHPLTFCATLIDHTTQIKFGTGVICMPQANPITVASQVAMFDHLSKGRFLMGVGPGSLSSDIEAYDVGSPEDRAKMVQEGVEIIHRLWSEEPPLEIDGEFWKIKLTDTSRYDSFGVGRLPKPYQKPYPPLAISIVTPKSNTAYVAGLKDWIPISGNFIQPRYVATHLPRYLEGCEAAGRKPDPSNWRVARSILVTDDAQQAEDEVADPNGVYVHYFSYLLSAFAARGAQFMLKPDLDVPDAELKVADVTKSMMTAGTPDSVLEQLIAFRDEVGPFGNLTYVAHDWDKPAVHKRSMTLLAEEVLPRFHQHCESTSAAAE